VKEQKPYLRNGNQFSSVNPVWNGGKMKFSIPDEREASDAFGTKELEKNFPEERLARRNFWRKGKMSSELWENFPTTLACTLTR
jgi:hypothetical protein